MSVLGTPKYVFFTLHKIIAFLHRQGSLGDPLTLVLNLEKRFYMKLVIFVNTNSLEKGIQPRKNYFR